MAKKNTAEPHAAEKATPATPPESATESPRKRIPVADLPPRSLRDALRVPQAITDNYGGDPTAPFDIAIALGVSPTSSNWRDLAASSMGYGLTKGSWSANKISLDEAGVRATAPREEGDDIAVRAEVALRPAIFKSFFGKYNKKKFPPDNIAINVLSGEFGVPRDRAEDALRTIKDNGQFVGFIRETASGTFVSIEDPQPVPVRLPAEEAEDDELDQDLAPDLRDGVEDPQATVTPPAQSRAQQSQMRVFISHGKNTDIVEQVKDILGIYDIDFEIAIEEETAAIPVPEKVMSAMRRCQAGIMVVTADEQNKIGDEYHINTNVLIEIGAAFVLYDQGVVLLWDKRLKVPSNLQGLYRLEFEGGELSFSTGTRLAKSVKTLGRKA